MYIFVTVPYLCFQIKLCLKVMINCAANSTNLPAFNSGFSKSDTIVSILPLTHGQQCDSALYSKMLLSLINPLLDCEQLKALKLCRKEANTCVSLLQQAFEDPFHMVQDFTLLTILNSVVWFTQEYSRKDIAPDKSEYESKMESVLQELESNIKLLVEEGVLPILKSVLKLLGQDDLQEAASRILFNLAHDSTVQAQILADIEMNGILQEIHMQCLSKLHKASYGALWLLGLQDDGMFKILNP